jgi:hypothetical protein
MITITEIIDISNRNIDAQKKELLKERKFQLNTKDTNSSGTGNLPLCFIKDKYEWLLRGKDYTTYSVAELTEILKIIKKLNGEKN